MKQSDIAGVLNRDPAWVSRQLRGPGNWTLKTIGELIEALNAEVEIRVFGREERVIPSQNFNAFSGYGYAHDRTTSQPTPINGNVVASGTLTVSVGMLSPIQQLEYQK
jgi:hypothetical protein